MLNQAAALLTAIDANKATTGRLLLNFELMKFGYPPAIIRKEDRLAYYDALDVACVGGDYGDITALVAESVLRSLVVYLEVLGLRPVHGAGSPPSSH